MPAFYEQYMVPLHFGWHGKLLADRLAYLTVGQVLETAAGTGAVTRALATILPEAVGITATDLNQPMLDLGAAMPPALAESAGVRLMLRRCRLPIRPSTR